MSFRGRNVIGSCLHVCAAVSAKVTTIMPASSMHMLYTSHLNRTLPICHTCPVTSSVVLCFVCVIFLPSTLSSRIVFLGTAGSVIILQGFVYEARMEQTNANSSANIK